MAIRHILLSVAWVFAGLVAGGQEKLTIEPAQPRRGDRVTIRYHAGAPGATIHDTATKVEMVFTYSNFYDLPNKVAMEKKGTYWETSFVYPPYATYATFYVQGGGQRDQPAADRHFALPVYEGGKRVFNGYLYEGYSLGAQKGRVPNLAKLQAALYARELKRFPDNYEARLRLLAYEMSVAKKAKAGKLRQRARAIIAAKFAEDPGNMGLMNKTTMGYLIIGENSRLDSIRRVVREQYPRSEAGYSLRIEAIRKEKDTAAMVQALETLLQEETAANARYLTGAHKALMEYYAQKRQAGKALYHLQKIGRDESPYEPQTLRRQAEVLLEAGIVLDTALQLAQRSLAMAHRFPEGVIRHFPETGYILPFVDAETRARSTQKARGNLLSLIGLIHQQQGHTAAANSLVKEAVQTSPDTETLQNAGVYYGRAGMPEAAFAVYKQVMLQMPENEAALDSMKTSYVRWKGGPAGWEHHEAELAAHWRKEMEADLKRQIMNVPAPDFIPALVDLNGKPVSAEAVRNKIVVIDFWATWCVPCMQEMPYVQNAYAKYKDDPGVLFMVINSGSKNTLQDAQGWWGNKRYSFPVFYNTDSKVGEKFGFNVIPATYILDTKGAIRFKTIGFEGPAIQRRIETAIELLKQEKSAVKGDISSVSTQEDPRKAQAR